MEADIAYIVTNGFALRMIIQTDLLNSLKTAGNSVALIVTDDQDPNVKNYCSRFDIPVYQFDIKGSFASNNYMFKRKYFLENVKENVALLEKHIFAVRYSRSMHPIRRLRPYYYWIIYKLIQKFPFLRDRFKTRELKYLKSQKAELLINNLKPKKLVSTYPVNYNEAVLLHYGNRNEGVQTWIHLLSWDNITCKGRFVETADRYIAWGPIMRNELIEYYSVNPDHIFECGVPHFDLHHQVRMDQGYRQYLQHLGLDDKKQFIFIAMSSPRFSPHEIDIVEWMANKIEEGYFGDDIQLVVRPHPQNMQGNMSDPKWLPRLKRLQKLSSTAVDFPMLAQSKLNWSLDISDMLRLSHIISGASITINSGSTICIDALHHEKPVIITAFDGDKELDYWKSARRLVDYPHLKKLVEFGGVKVTYSYLELTKLVQALLHDPNIDIEKRRETLENECTNSDGTATQTVIRTLTV